MPSNIIATFILLLGLSIEIQANQPDCKSWESLKIGMTPWAPARFLQKWGESFEQSYRLHCLQVTMSSAKNVEEFIRKGLNNEFDVLLISGTGGLYLEDKGNFSIPYIGEITAEMIVFSHSDFAIKQLTDLNHHSVSLTDPMQSFGFVSREFIRRNNLQPKKIVNAAFSYNVFYQVLNKEAESGIASRSLYQTMPTAIQSKFRIIHSEMAYVPPVIVVRSDLSMPIIQKVVKAYEVSPPNFPLQVKWLPADDKQLIKLRSYFKKHMAQMRSRLEN